MIISFWQVRKAPFNKCGKAKNVCGDANLFHASTNLHIFFQTPAISRRKKR